MGMSIEDWRPIGEVCGYSHYTKYYPPRDPEIAYESKILYKCYQFEPEIDPTGFNAITEYARSWGALPGIPYKSMTLGTLKLEMQEGIGLYSFCDAHIWIGRMHGDS